VQDELVESDSKESIALLTVATRTRAIGLLDAMDSLLRTPSVRLRCGSEVDSKDLEAADLLVYEVRVLEAFEDIKAIRSLKSRRPMLPVIAISDNMDVELIDEAFKAGVVSFVSSSTDPYSFITNCRNISNLGGSARMVEMQNSEMIETLRDLRSTNAKLKQEMEERKIAEEERALAMEQSFASSKLASLGEMAGSIAHEIKTPLAVVTGSISMIREMISDTDQDSQEVYSILKDVETMMDRIAAIVRGLKAYSRPDEQDPFESVRVQDIVDDTISLIQDSLAQSDVEFEIKKMPQNLYISCRPTQISQILINLLNNAKYEVEPKSDGKITLEAYRKVSGDIEIVVSDNGNGIADDKVEKVFKAFFTTKPKGIGTGLGLNICQKIAQGHGGSMRLEQAPGMTKFILTLKEAIVVNKAS